MLFDNSFHLAVCLTTGPKPVPNRALHIVRSKASSFKCEYPLLSLRSSSSFLRFLPRLPVTSVPPFIFPSITHFYANCDQSSYPSVSLFHVGYSSASLIICNMYVNVGCLTWKWYLNILTYMLNEFPHGGPSLCSYDVTFIK